MNFIFWMMEMHGRVDLQRRVMRAKTQLMQGAVGKISGAKTMEELDYKIACSDWAIEKELMPDFCRLCWWWNWDGHNTTMSELENHLKETLSDYPQPFVRKISLKDK